jgi:hypothetical protein
MGIKLLRYFHNASKQGSLKAKMRLVVLTNISSQTASKLPDSPDNIRKFEKAMIEIRSEFKQQEGEI